MRAGGLAGAAITPALWLKWHHFLLARRFARDCWRRDRLDESDRVHVGTTTRNQRRRDFRDWIWS
jgi:hypothetical protein